MRTKARPLTAPIAAVLHKLGADIRDARRRRRIPMGLLAERASISRLTLAAVERGEPGVGICHIAAVLYSLGLLERLADLADFRYDKVGVALEEDRLPQRVHLPRNL